MRRHCRWVGFFLVAVLATSPLLAQSPAAVQSAQPATPTPESILSLGAVFSVGGGFPRYVVDPFCESARSFGFGLMGTWMPFGEARWIGIETEGRYVSGPIDMCAIPDLAPEGERQVIEADLSTPFGALSTRLLLLVPFGQARIRLHVGGGISAPGRQPILTRGVGVVVRRGRLSGSVVLDWWTLWPGGDRFHEEWDTQGTRRERIGSFDQRFDVRFVGFSLGWDVSGLFHRRAG